MSWDYDAIQRLNPAEREFYRKLYTGTVPTEAAKVATNAGASSYETDSDLSGRVRYVAGDLPELHTAHGDELVRIAERYGLKRRVIAPSGVKIGIDPGTHFHYGWRP